MYRLRSGTAVFRTAPNGRILEWNDAAERLTGVTASEAQGRACWEILAGRGADGELLCHPGCSVLRLAREGWPVRPLDARVRLADGEARLTLSTIVLGDGGEEPVVLHTLSEAPRHAAASPGCARLTPRQGEILQLLARGNRPRQIASQLTLSETTVRNHIQAILLALGVHSQLEAVAQLGYPPQRGGAQY
ncbi:MAG TPA: LuxR C-terminal-related transcriptional regulator [Gaiellaceae bacterium]|nr:LuxR C-terminal-related transcriptional regulator [Gaiellaceae bacterium]